TTGRGRVVGQFLETGAIQDSERNFYTAPEVTTLLELAGFERLTVAGDLALGMSPQEAEPSFLFRARRRQSSPSAVRVDSKPRRSDGMAITPFASQER